jgi:hypothetical protein
MGRVYTATFSGVAVTAAQDLFELTLPADMVVRILSCRIGQTSDAGDAAAEMLPIAITRYATNGSGGSSGVTSRPHHSGDAASTVTVDTNNTTQGGTPVVVLADAWNVQAGWLYQPPPDEMIYASPNSIIAIELPSAPADSITMEGSITFEEIGG